MEGERSAQGQQQSSHGAAWYGTCSEGDDDVDGTLVGSAGATRSHCWQAALRSVRLTQGRVHA